MSQENYVISESLNEIGMPILAKDAVRQSDGGILQGYVKTIVNYSQKNNRQDLLERLWSVGLWY